MFASLDDVGGVLFLILGIIAVAALIYNLVTYSDRNNPFSQHYQPPVEIEIDTAWLASFAQRCSGGYHFVTGDCHVEVKMSHPAWEATILAPDHRVDAPVRTRSDLRAFLASHLVDMPREAG